MLLQSRIVLFLFGTSIASAHVLRNGKHCGHAHASLRPAPIAIAEHLPALHPMDVSGAIPPFLSHFAQQGPNLFYKPHISLSPPPLPIITELKKKKDCKKPLVEPPKIVLHEPLPAPVVMLPEPVEEVIETKPMVIPQAPELPPFIMPELPVPVLVQEPAPPAPFPMIPEAPIFEVHEHAKPIEVPQAPELPPLHLPELPVPVKVEVAPPCAPIALPALPELPAPIHHDFIPYFPNPAFNEIEVLPIPSMKPIDIPVAPELPPLVLPEIPAHVQFDIAPPAVPSLTPEIMEYKPINIPQAPVLPPFVMPEIPAPVIIEEPKLPCLHDLIIPSAPELKPVVIPEIPFQVQEIVETRPLAIPQPPELPPFTMPEIPNIVVEAPAPVPFVPPAPLFVEAVESVPPCPPEVPIVEYVKPMPEAPFLPPFSIPQPTKVEILPPVHDYVIPTAPVLPPVEYPAVPLLVEEPIQVEEPCLDDEIVEVRPPTVIEGIPSYPAQIPTYPAPIPTYPAHGPALTNFYAQNIMIDRILPNLMVGEKNYPKNLELVPTGAQYPVYPKSFLAPY